MPQLEYKNTNRLYEHITDGGAVYLCAKGIKCPNGEYDGDMATAILRIDGGEIEVLTHNTKEHNINVIIK